MSLKRLNNKQVEIITDKHEVYVSKEKHGFEMDVFNSSIKNHDEAHKDSQICEDFPEVEQELKSWKVSAEDIAELKRLWKID